MKVKIIGKFESNKGVFYHCIEDTPNENKHVVFSFSNDKSIQLGDVCNVYSYCYNGNWYKKIKKGV